jgi:hypothetical protein
VSLKRRVLAIGVVSAALFAAPAAAHAAIVTNGDFETGSLSGWQVNVTPNPDTGTWFAYSGTTTPLNSFTVPAPPQGRFAAVTDQEGSSTRILYQDVQVPTGGTVAQLGMFVYYDSQAAITSLDSLDPTGGANQQYRVDVIRPGAPLDSVASGDVLVNVFRTATGAPQSLGPTQRTADLTPFAGQTIRIRLAEVDNQLFFNAAADAILVKSNGFTIGRAVPNKKKGTARLPVTVPDAGTLALSGKGVKGIAASKSVAVSGAGVVNLLIKAKGKTKRKLNERGKAKVKASITYTPTGLTGNTEQAKVKLKKKT